MCVITFQYIIHTENLRWLFGSVIDHRLFKCCLYLLAAAGLGVENKRTAWRKGKERKKNEKQMFISLILALGEKERKGKKNDMQMIISLILYEDDRNKTLSGELQNLEHFDLTFQRWFRTERRAAKDGRAATDRVNIEPAIITNKNLSATLPVHQFFWAEAPSLSVARPRGRPVSSCTGNCF